MTNENWRHGIYYQIYPRSFRDTSGNGIGDLKGITEKLDYIASLGVDGIWISPFFKSPQKDFGYDVSDYRDIDPMYGTLADFDTLLDKAHALDLKIIVDLVLSHTSDQHPWFTEKPDYYVWADGIEEEEHAPYGQSIFSADETQATTSRNNSLRSEATQSAGKRRRPPNNWVSVFGGSAWEWHEGRQQYYLHNFLKEQPDLNYHNPQVQQEALDIARYWLDRGVDAFRLDVINFLFHDQELRNNPPRPPELGAATQFEGADPYSEQQHIYDKSQPEMLAFLQRFRAMCDEYDGTFTLGEIGDDNPYTLSAQYTSGGDKLNTTYNPQMMSGKTKALTEDIIRVPIEKFHSHVQIMPRPAGHPAWAFSNHDVVRAQSRWLNNSDGFSHNPALSKMLIRLLACLPGTLFMYQGEELGLPEAELRYEDLQDPWGKSLWPEWQGRDGCRTPMPWSPDTPNGWLPVPDAHRAMSIQTQEADPASTLNYTRDVLAWRKTQPALMHDDIQFHHTNDPLTLSFSRITEEQTLLCSFDLKNYTYAITDVTEKE